MKAEKTQKEGASRAIQTELGSRGRTYMEDNRPGAVGQAKMIENSQFKDFPRQLKSSTFNKGGTIQRVRILDSGTLGGNLQKAWMVPPWAIIHPNKEKGEKANAQAHHIIPNEVVVDAYEKAAIDNKLPPLTDVISNFDKAWNGIYLPTEDNVTLDLPIHDGSHPQYSKEVRSYILKTYENTASIIPNFRKDFTCAKNVASHFRNIITMWRSQLKDIVKKEKEADSKGTHSELIENTEKIKSISQIKDFYRERGRSLATSDGIKIARDKHKLRTRTRAACDLFNCAEINDYFEEEGREYIHSIVYKPEEESVSRDDHSLGSEESTSSPSSSSSFMHRGDATSTPFPPSKPSHDFLRKGDQSKGAAPSDSTWGGLMSSSSSPSSSSLMEREPDSEDEDFGESDASEVATSSSSSGAMELDDPRDGK